MNGFQDERIDNVRSLVYVHSEERERRVEAHCKRVEDEQKANRWNNRNRKRRYKKPKGYFWNKSMKKYQAQIKVDCKTIHLGCFVKAKDARNAYLEAKGTK